MSEVTPQRKIHKLLDEITLCKMDIDDIAKEHIPNFHFLNHRVSNFWKCEKSPIGWCVWDISERGFNKDVQCYYCRGPVERK